MQKIEAQRNTLLAVFAALLTTGLLISLKVASQPATPQTTAARPPELSSDELAKQPQTPGATGDQQRHYYFAEAKVESPYRIYVPQNYDGKTKMPVILALHGAGGNQNYFFKATYGMPDIVEKSGFIFVEPLGDGRFGGYGAALLPRVPVDPDPNTIPNPVPAGRPQLTPEEAQRATDLSEKDVMNVLDIVEKEYNVDLSRVFLMGHSMGGNGAWYLGQKYADKWAAIAPMSAGFGYVNYPLDRLKGIPIMVTAGARDVAMHGPQAQAQLARFKAAGLDIRYLEIPDGSHMSNIPSSFSQVIQFFATHHR